jgi:hypothetical protein
MHKDDLLEIDFNLDFYDPDDIDSVDVWVYRKDDDDNISVIKDAAGAYRQYGLWVINYKMLGRVEAIAYFPADSVAYLSVVINFKPEHKAN